MFILPPLKNFVNGKYLEANTKAIHATKSTLNDEYLSKISNFDSAFILWNALVSLDEQKQYMESDSDDRSDASNICYMVQGVTPLR